MHIRGSHVVAEWYEEPALPGVVLWDSLFEEMTGDESILGDFWIVGEVALSLELD